MARARQCYDARRSVLSAYDFRLMTDLCDGVGAVQGCVGILQKSGPDIRVDAVQALSLSLLSLFFFLVVRQLLYNIQHKHSLNPIQHALHAFVFSSSRTPGGSSSDHVPLGNRLISTRSSTRLPDFLSSNSLFRLAVLSVCHPCIYSNFLKIWRPHLVSLPP